MSENKKNGVDSRDEFLSKNSKTAKKYPSETTRRNILPENRPHELKDSIETANGSLPAIPMQVTHEKSELPIIKILDRGGTGELSSNTDCDRSESNEQKPPHLLEQTAESLTENNMKLNLTEVAAKNEKREKIHSENLTKEEIDDICGKYGSGKTYTKTRTPGLDPRFQQQNQTLRCFVMYTDFYRCEKILGEGEIACQWFKDVFTTICPLDWIRRWDEARETGILPWMKSKTQGKFPGDRYGV